MPKKKRMPTLWQVPNDLWERMKELTEEYDPSKTTGRKREDARQIIDGLIFRFRTGCQWNHIPTLYGDDSTLHRTFQRWEQIGLFEKIWSLLVAECEELGQLDWQWQAADAALSKSALGRRRSRSESDGSGQKRHQTEPAGGGRGGPLAVVVATANVHDTKLLAQTLCAVVVERPGPTKHRPQHLCLDKAYDNPTGEQAVQEHHYIGHIRRIGEEKLDEKRKKKYPARRWVVERTLAWLSKCRGILVRYEKKAKNYLALVQFACALLWYRRLAYASF